MSLRPDGRRPVRSCSPTLAFFTLSLCLRRACSLPLDLSGHTPALNSRYPSRIPSCRAEQLARPLKHPFLLHSCAGTRETTLSASLSRLLPGQILLWCAIQKPEERSLSRIPHALAAHPVRTPPAPVSHLHLLSACGRQHHARRPLYSSPPPAPERSSSISSPTALFHPSRPPRSFLGIFPSFPHIRSPSEDIPAPGSNTTPHPATLGIRHITASPFSPQHRCLSQFHRRHRHKAALSPIQSHTCHPVPPLCRPWKETKTRLAKAAAAKDKAAPTHLCFAKRLSDNVSARETREVTPAFETHPRPQSPPPISGPPTPPRSRATNHSPGKTCYAIRSPSLPPLPVDDPHPRDERNRRSTARSRETSQTRRHQPALHTQTRSSTPMSDTESTMSRMQFHNGIRGFYTRVHKIIGLRRRKQEKRSLDISAPFNFQKVSMDLAGISADELSLLKEQAVASRIGIADPEDDAMSGRPGLMKSASGPVISIVPATPYMTDGHMGRQAF